MSAGRIVVVGASLAGARVAETLRRSGYGGRIVLVGAEPHRPYDRPPLSKKFLRGQHPEERLYLRPPEHYDRLRIDLALGVRAIGLSSTARRVELEGGRSIDFDQLVIATGAEVRRLDVPGATLPGVYCLRTIEDARAIREEIRPGRRAVVIGAGVIGAEVAASLREEGVEVVMLEAEHCPLRRAFGEPVGRIYAEIHRAHGVDLRTGVHVVALRGATRVEEVRTADGACVPCDFVVVGIGVRPATAWLEGSGIALEHGAVLVDEYGATNVPGIWAAGDVASAWHPALRRRLRIESVDNAQNQAVAVAANVLGKRTPYAPVPFFWSDQYDLKMQSVGHVGEHDRVVFRGSIPARAFVAFHLLGDRLAFTIAVGRMKENAAAKKLIAAGVPVRDEQLADDTFDLGTLVPAKVAAAGA